MYFHLNLIIAHQKPLLHLFNRLFKFLLNNPYFSPKEPNSIRYSLFYFSQTLNFFPSNHLLIKIYPPDFFLQKHKLIFLTQSENQLIFPKFIYNFSQILILRFKSDLESSRFHFLLKFPFHL
jgi:hypothetical protein